MDRITFATTNFIVGLTCAAIMLTLLKHAAKKVHYIWAFFNLIVCIWAFGAFSIALTQTPEQAMWRWKIALIGSIFSSVLFYHVIVAVAELNRKWLLRFFYLYSLVFYIFTFYNLVDLKIVIIADSLYYVKATNYKWTTFVIGWAFIIFWTLFELYRLYKKSSANKRLQYQYLLVGFVFGFLGAFLSAAPMFGFAFVPYANILMCAYSAIFAYAILRHQLMDIEVIIKKTLVFAGLFTSVFVVVGVMTFILQKLLGKFIAINNRLFLAINIAILILLYDPIRSFLINVTNKYLFQKKYDPVELIMSFSKSVLTELDLDKIAKSTIDKLTSALNLTNCAIFIPNKEGNKFVVKESYGMTDPAISYTGDSPLMSYLGKVNAVILRYDKNTESRTVINDMDLAGASVCLAIMIHRQLIGMLSLGRKKSDEDYTKKDIETLLFLSDALGIAITNALTFEDVRQKEKLATIGTLAAGIKHDIGTPINKMSSAVQMFLIAREEGDHKKAKAEEVLSIAYDLLARCQMTFEKVSSISSKFADFARPKKKAESELINILESIESALGVLDHEIQAKNISIKKEMQQDIQLLMADKDYMQQIFFNIIRNAIQAIEEAGRTKEESIITIRAKEDSDRNVRVEISDTGIGIAEDNLTKIFEPYYSTKPEDKGTGLGLAIVKELVERNKGTISVNSHVGKGTTFILQFKAQDGN